MGNAGVYQKLEQQIKETEVTIEYMVPNTPEQNGVAERLNRTVFTLVRAMLKQADLLVRF